MPPKILRTMRSGEQQQRKNDFDGRRAFSCAGSAMSSSLHNPTVVLVHPLPESCRVVIAQFGGSSTRPLDATISGITRALVSKRRSISLFLFLCPLPFQSRLTCSFRSSWSIPRTAVQSRRTGTPSTHDLMESQVDTLLGEMIHWQLCASSTI